MLIKPLIYISIFVIQIDKGELVRAKFESVILSLNVCQFNVQKCMGYVRDKWGICTNWGTYTNWAI